MKNAQIITELKALYRQNTHLATEVAQVLGFKIKGAATEEAYKKSKQQVLKYLQQIQKSLPKLDKQGLEVRHGKVLDLEAALWQATGII